jgi:hypothetical protein
MRSTAETTLAASPARPLEETVWVPIDKRLQLPVREAQFRFQQRCPFFDLVEGVPSEASACPTAAAQHSAPVTRHDPVDLYETPEISGDAVMA